MMNGFLIGLLATSIGRLTAGFFTSRALLVGTRTVYGLVLLMLFSMMMEYSKRPSAPTSLRMIFFNRPM